MEQHKVTIKDFIGKSGDFNVFPEDMIQTVIKLLKSIEECGDCKDFALQQFFNITNEELNENGTKI